MEKTYRVFKILKIMYFAETSPEKKYEPNITLAHFCRKLQLLHGNVAGQTSALRKLYLW